MEIPLPDDGEYHQRVAEHGGEREEEEEDEQADAIALQLLQVLCEVWFRRRRDRGRRETAVRVEADQVRVVEYQHGRLVGGVERRQVIVIEYHQLRVIPVVLRHIYHDEKCGRATVTGVNPDYLRVRW